MIAIGDRFTLTEEGIAGIVAEVFYDELAAPAAIVVEQDDGTWAAVDMSMIAPRVLH